MKEEMNWKKMEGKHWKDRVRKREKREGRLTLESKEERNEKKKVEGGKGIERRDLKE